MTAKWDFQVILLGRITECQMTKRKNDDNRHIFNPASFVCPYHFPIGKSREKEDGHAGGICHDQ